MLGSICTWFCSYNSACINIFIHRSRRCDHSEYAVGLALKQIAYHAVVVSADRTSAASTIGFHSNS